MNKLSTFLNKHYKQNGQQYTHTRIADKSLDIKGGSYHIAGDDLLMFQTIYYNEVIKGNKMEYLTEKQPKISGGIYVDLDFRYNTNIDSRQHTPGWVEELVIIYTEEIKKLVKFENNDTFKCYIMEKPNVNPQENYTKDGLHLLFNIEMDRKIQQQLRTNIINNTDMIELINTLPIINSLEDIFDIGLTTGANNNQMFGSRKPDNEAYDLTGVKVFQYDATDGEFCMTNSSTDLTFDLFRELSTQEPKLKFNYTPLGQKILLKLDIPKSPTSVVGLYTQATGNELIDEYTAYANMIDIKAINYYPIWSKLVWAFRSMGDALKPVALLMTKRSPLYQEEDYFNKVWDCGKTDGKATKEYIWGCAKRSNEAEYIKIRLTYNKKTTELWDKMINSSNDVNVRNVFLELYPNQFVCCDKKTKEFYSINDTMLWDNTEDYVITNKLDAIITLLENDKFTLTNKLRMLEKGTDDHTYMCKKIKQYDDIINKMGSNGIRKNITTEIVNNIINPKFRVELNKITDWISVKNNEMLNWKTLETRQRTADDKFTYNYDAIYKRDITQDDMDYADKYFKTLFNNNDGTKQIVINILKTIFCGKKMRNMFFYTGSGCNGKSLLFNVLKSIFTGAMSVIGNDVILENRNKGQLNTELEKLETTIFGYTTELKESDELNTTMIKKISGGDDIDCRALFKSNRTITPTANLSVLTNKMPYFVVEPAILKRMIVIPMNSKFEVNTSFETEIMSKKDILFTYIMKKGIYTPELNQDDLTDEMKVAMEEYREDNIKDYLQEFMQKTFKDCEYNNDAPLAIKNKTRVKCDTFITEYKAYLKQNGYTKEYDNNVKFIRKMKREYNQECIRTNNINYFIGLERLPYNANEEDEELETCEF
jgi:phage/plasmid-associated DNA primase